ncbi:uncharacterized protein LOC136042704 [Artemia franciscana]|uniref:uncharacterized protein LOC136042704 n=1 Tax=Artemia franciscana TaxID=6661 RepID=UPI0032DB8D02
MANSKRGQGGKASAQAPEKAEGEPEEEEFQSIQSSSETDQDIADSQRGQGGKASAQAPKKAKGEPKMKVAELGEDKGSKGRKNKKVKEEQIYSETDQEPAPGTPIKNQLPARPDLIESIYKKGCCAEFGDCCVGIIEASKSESSEISTIFAYSTHLCGFLYNEK